MTKRISQLFVLLVASMSLAFGQATLSSTTLSSAVASTDAVVNVASATGITAVGSLNAIQTLLFIDREEMNVTAVNGTVISVTRGFDSTPITAHASGATVWLGPPAYFYQQKDPSGSCTAGNLLVLPVIAVQTGEVWTCPTSGPNNGLWSKQATAAPLNLSDAAFFVPASDCNTSVSGNATGTNGYTVAGASNTPVVQASTSNTGTNTHTYVCTIQLPTRLTSTKGAAIKDVVFYYGVQTSALGTQVATLASGTMNSSTVFSSITFPAAGASETASTVTPVRADSGTLLITPVVASANTATTTAGAFYSTKFTPATPIALTTDLQTVLFTVTLQAAATSATVTNSPGILVHFINSPL